MPILVNYFLSISILCKQLGPFESIISYVFTFYVNIEAHSINDSNFRVHCDAHAWYVKISIEKRVI